MRRLTAYMARKWVAFTEWAAWAAWNHARKRAIARAKWVPQEAKDASQDSTPDQRRIRANEARQVLENRHFTGAWDALNAALEAQILGCNPDDKDKTARLVVSKQLLHGLKREFERKLSDGYMAEAELDEIERRRRPVRMVR